MGVARISSNPRVAATDIVQQQLEDLPNRFKGMSNDFYCIMPNHLHWIIVIESSAVGFTLPQVIGAFKSLTTRAIKQSRATQALRLQFGEW